MTTGASIVLLKFAIIVAGLEFLRKTDIIQRIEKAIFKRELFNDIGYYFSMVAERRYC